MVGSVEITVNHSNGHYECVLKKNFGYAITVYDEFDRDNVLDMLLYIDNLSTTTSEVDSSSNKILTDLNKIAENHHVTQKHLEQLLKVLEWNNVVSSQWHSKNHEEEQKLRKVITDM